MPDTYVEGRDDAFIIDEEYLQTIIQDSRENFQDYPITRVLNMMHSRISTESRDADLLLIHEGDQVAFIGGKNSGVQGRLQQILTSEKEEVWVVVDGTGKQWGIDDPNYLRPAKSVEKSVAESTGGPSIAPADQSLSISSEDTSKTEAVVNEYGGLWKTKPPNCAATEGEEFSYGDKVYKINELLFPGPIFGDEIFASLDDLYFGLFSDESKKYTPEDLLKIATFFALIIYTTQGYKDGNQRAAVSAADFITERFSDNKFVPADINLNQYKEYIFYGACTLLPDEENPWVVLETQEEDRKVLDLMALNRQKNSTAIMDFYRRYTDSILEAIGQFKTNLNVEKPYVRNMLNSIASELKNAIIVPKK